MVYAVTEKVYVNMNASARALTLVEMLLAMAIMAVVFAVIAPQFYIVRKNWDSKAANAEVLQNARVLMEHINRNLAQASRISSVSAAADTDGYIEFIDNDDNTIRYDIAANNYVEFGQTGSLSDLAGSVSTLQFTCYDDSDLDNPLDPVTDPNQIRMVKVATTFTNPYELSQDLDLETAVYIRTNGGGGSSLSGSTPYEYDIVIGLNPAIETIDTTHYLCVYTSSNSDGWACVLAVDTNDWTVTEQSEYEYEPSDGADPAVVKIDDTHYLCAYSGAGNDGHAVVLTVNPSTWAISNTADYEFDNKLGEYPSLVKINDSHYLCAYSGPGSDGWAVVLAVDGNDWSTSAAGSSFEFDDSTCIDPALVQIDATHYLCVYSGVGSDGWASVLTVNTSTWNITEESTLEYDTSNGLQPAVAQIDSTHYLCAYRGPDNDGWAVVLTVDPSTYAISKSTPFEYDTSDGITPALVQIDTENYLCAYQGPDVDGWAAVLQVNTADWTVSKTADNEYDIAQGSYPALAQIDSEHYLCSYTGSGSDGWAVVLGLDVVP